MTLVCQHNFLKMWQACWGKLNWYKKIKPAWHSISLTDRYRTTLYARSTHPAAWVRSTVLPSLMNLTRKLSLQSLLWISLEFEASCFLIIERSDFSKNSKTNFCYPLVAYLFPVWTIGWRYYSCQHWRKGPKFSNFDT